MWLKDFLPHDIKNVRIMSYGYNSNLVGDTVDDRFLDYRTHLIQMLMNARRSAEEELRPIIFIGHSMGGILILQSLLKSKNGSQYKHLFDSTRAIFFFGTPHQGLEVNELLSMVEDVSQGKKTSRSELVKQLREGSDFLDTQRDDITNLWGPTSNIQIFSFYETKKTPTVRKSTSGSWTRDGGEVGMVKRNSAQLFWQFEHRIPVAKNHTNIVKFAAMMDNTYQTVVTHMVKCVNTIVTTPGNKKKEDIEYNRERIKILNWLYAGSTSNRHNDIREQRKEGIGDWLLKTTRFQQWMQGETRSPLLWAHGIAGAGKTFLCSNVIDYLRNRALAAQYGVAYIYFNYKEQDQQKPVDILASLVKQLAHQSLRLPAHLEELHDKFTQGEYEGKRPTYKELYTALIETSKSFAQTFIICDALDECDRQEQREILLPLFHRMGERGIRLFMTSRRYPDDIEDSYRHVPEIEIFAHEDDIRRYISQRIDANPRARRMIRGSEREESIMSELVNAASGM
ncbi:hypothetical protein K440DRAFT_683829 [Wilcoxina mikolae CBS 423.85]|nr:hypothetical protein K440DRAFT_683829 [Wilcoxina mikolae CBS 423.85]